jgi:hypothetical protein
LRYTRGAALFVSGKADDGLPDATPQVTYLQRAPDWVLVFKHDVETTDGSLDRNRRGGGWGAVAGHVGRQLGGIWTARSKRTLAGTLRVATLNVAKPR